MGVELLKGTPVVCGLERGDLCVPWILSMGWFLRFKRLGKLDCSWSRMCRKAIITTGVYVLLSFIFMWMRDT